MFADWTLGFGSVRPPLLCIIRESGMKRQQNAPFEARHGSSFPNRRHRIDKGDVLAREDATQVEQHAVVFHTGDDGRVAET